MGAFTCKVTKKVNPIIVKHYKFYFIYLFIYWEINLKFNYIAQDNLWICKAVTKISICQVNATIRWGIKQLGISSGSIFLLFSYEGSRGPY